MFANMIFFDLWMIGIPASLFYFVINAVFFGNVFFPDTERFMRFVLGGLLLIILLSVVSWVIMMIYNLDVLSSMIVLIIGATIPSAMSKIKGRRITE